LLNDINVMERAQRLSRRQTARALASKVRRSRAGPRPCVEFGSR